MFNIVYLGKKEVKMLWYINKKCYFNGFFKVKKIFYILFIFKYFFVFIIVLNFIIRYERDRYVKSVMYKNNKFLVCFGNINVL